MPDYSQMNTTELFSTAAKNAKDMNAAKQIFQTYKLNMYNEAMLYLNDEQEAKNTVVRAFWNAHANIQDADTDNPEAWLNKYVQDDCIAQVLPLSSSNTKKYTSEDEKGSDLVLIPSSTNQCRRKLISALQLLTPGQRLTAVLRFRERMSLEEIADRLKCDINTVKNVLTESKTSVTAQGQNLSVLMAIADKLFPRAAEEQQLDLNSVPKNDKSPASDITAKTNEDVDFTTSVLELKSLFEQQKTKQLHYSDFGIDEEENSEEEEQSAEQHNAEEDVNHTQQLPVVNSSKVINVEENNRYIDNSDEDDEESYKKGIPWLKYVLILLIIALLGFAGGLGYSMLNQKDKAAAPSAEPEQTEETAEENDEETADNDAEESSDGSEETPEQTPEPEAPAAVGSAYIIVTDLNIRKGPGVGYEINGMAELEKTYDVLEIAEADGYTWYKVGDEQWIPDLAGQYVTYTAK